jgi:tetratricopeptide (TPR) repeat protein
MRVKQNMHPHTIFVFALVALAGCASPPAEETFYNKGVNAYRINDYSTARGHWSKAVEQGEVSAMNNLGYLLFEGLGGQPDVAHALALWRRAASLGHSEAQWHLGEAYERGKGVQPDLKEAYAWYRCAISSAQAAPGSDATEAEILQDASKSLAKLLERLPPEQFADAEQLAKQYVSKYARRGRV